MDSDSVASYYYHDNSSTDTLNTSNYVATSDIHVEFVATSEFDIDAGPVVRYQYPTIVPGNALTAELLLPDQSHARTEDWTVFFLYRRKNYKILQYHISDETEKSQATQLYVLNLVNTKFDEGLKRGAIVKSMCIVTRHEFYHVFKPLLLLALDEYFNNPSMDCLQRLYESLNSLDLSSIPNLSSSERVILSESQNPNMLRQKFQDPPRSSITSTTNGKKRSTSSTGSDDMKPTYYLDLKNQGQRLVSRNSIRDTHFFESQVVYNGLKIPIKIPTDTFPDSVGDFSLIKLISILFSISSPFQLLHPELTIYGPSTPAILVLIYAILTQKKVLFIGLNTPSKEVADIVLAACALSSGGILRSIITNAFPYTDLSKVDDLLDSPGYIAGVKNPAFGHHPSWWDVIIDLEECTMRISSAIGSPVVNGSSKHSSSSAASISSSAYSTPSGYPVISAEDQEFVDEIKRMVTDHYGESSIRARCRQYIKRMVRIAINYEEFKYGKTNLWPSATNSDYHIIPGYGYAWKSENQKLQDFSSYSSVFEGWRASQNYSSYVKDQINSWPTKPKSVLDYDYHMDRLRYHKLSHEESAAIFSILSANTKDYDEINRLLATSNLNNLFYVSLGLFHRDAAVRNVTVLLLQRIEKHMAGHVFFESMSSFQKLAYKRLKSEMKPDLKGASSLEHQTKNSLSSEEDVAFKYSEI